MDTELARTFLAVVAAASFSRAAERLHITQSTVSARINALETLLGCKLLVRNKAGVRLTPAGAQFSRHATVLVRTVAHAHHDVGIPKGFRSVLSVGGRIGLWEGLMDGWLGAMRRAAPDVAVRAEIGFEPDLMHGLVEGRLDIGIMYTPQNRPGLRIEPLLVERLVLVATENAPDAPGPDHIYVDWGPEFYAQHSARFPEFAVPPLSTNIGWLGLRHILAHGGSGYFPHRLVRALVNAGTLRIAADAPVFALPAYVVVCPRDGDAALEALALDLIRNAVARVEGSDAPVRTDQPAPR